MSLELLDKLEERVTSALETLEITQLELEEERLRSIELEQQRDNLQSENQRIRSELAEYEQRVTELFSKMPSGNA